MDLEECIEKKYLIKIQPAEDLMLKEFKEADYDLKSAKKALIDKDYKWCIVKSYYCLFHSARAILFKLGLREKRHFAIGIVLGYLNKKGKLESIYVNYFNAAVSSREDADYNYVYSKEKAENCFKIACEFVKEMKQLAEKV